MLIYSHLWVTLNIFSRTENIRLSHHFLSQSRNSLWVMLSFRVLLILFDTYGWLVEKTPLLSLPLLLTRLLHLALPLPLPFHKLLRLPLPSSLLMLAFWRLLSPLPLHFPRLLALPMLFPCLRPWPCSCPSLCLCSCCFHCPCSSPWHCPCSLARPSPLPLPMHLPRPCLSSSRLCGHDAPNVYCGPRHSGRHSRIMDCN